MSSRENNICRVYLEGLSANERTILGGMFRLARQVGTHFQVEPESGKANIFIIDGSNQHRFDFGETHPQAAQRTIWIDPPADVNPVRQIRRPMNWGTLLQLMEAIISNGRESAAAQEKPRVVKLSLSQLCELAEDVLRQHLGIAAEFIVEDLRADINTRSAAGESLTLTLFLDTLKSQLPAHIDSKKVLAEVAASISRAQRG